MGGDLSGTVSSNMAAMFSSCCESSSGVDARKAVGRASLLDAEALGAAWGARKRAGSEGAGMSRDSSASSVSECVAA